MTQLMPLNYLSHSTNVERLEVQDEEHLKKKPGQPRKSAAMDFTGMKNSKMKTES